MCNTHVLRAQKRIIIRRQTIAVNTSLHRACLKEQLHKGSARKRRRNVKGRTATARRSSHICAHGKEELRHAQGGVLCR